MDEIRLVFLCASAALRLCVRFFLFVKVSHHRKVAIVAVIV